MDLFFVFCFLCAFCFWFSPFWFLFSVFFVFSFLFCVKGGAFWYVMHICFLFAVWRVSILFMGVDPVLYGTLMYTWILVMVCLLWDFMGFMVYYANSCQFKFVSNSKLTRICNNLTRICNLTPDDYYMHEISTFFKWF